MALTYPNEIWLEIFKRIDRPKLMELRLVCHQFYDLIEYLLNQSPEWKSLAFNTILYECLEMTMQRAYPYYLACHWMDIDDPALWRGTYLSYKKWQKVLVNSHTKDTIVPEADLGTISCLSTFDKYIAISFHCGLIASYTVDDLSRPFYLANHGTSIKQVEFWYSDGNVMFVSVGDDCTLKFWDLQNKIEIVTDGFLANSISSGECRHFCIAEKGGIVTSYEKVGNRILPGPTLELTLNDEQHVIAHAADGKNMTAMAWQEGGIVLFLYRALIAGEKLTEFAMVQKTDWKRLPTNLASSLQRLSMPTAVFFFGIGQNCIGMTNYYEDIWHEYNLSQHFGCNVRSVAVHAEILMFGLEDGSVYLLYNSHNGYVMELEETIKHSRKIQVDTVPIEDLTVLEVDKKPCIVAVTIRKVHLLNFF
ncbi:uncharacterized protein LOC142983958 isoform X2 [Anticarsia gemmatalis]